MQHHSYCQFCGYDPYDALTDPNTECEGCTEDVPFGLTIPVPPFDQHRISVDMDSLRLAKTCQRCGLNVEEAYFTAYKQRLFIMSYEDEWTGEERFMRVCWTCDHEIINGDELIVDEYELWQERQLHAYECDPINNDPPPGYYS